MEAKVPFEKLLDLSGKVAIVTGGAMGIGYGISHRLSEAGAKVVVADLDLAAAEKTAREVKSPGFGAKAVKKDVSQQK